MSCAYDPTKATRVDKCSGGPQREWAEIDLCGDAAGAGVEEDRFQEAIEPFCSSSRFKPGMKTWVVRVCVLRASYVCPTSVLRVSYERPTCVLRASYVCPTCVLRVSYVCPTCVLRASYVCPTSVLRVSYERPTCFLYGQSFWTLRWKFMLNVWTIRF